MHEANLEGAVLVNREKTLVISKRSENMFNAIHFGAIIRIIARKHYLCFAPLVFCRTYRTANILHNSNYQSVFGCKEAIDRYFAGRNQAFLENPRRAGNKIWGKERVEAVFREENNCKDPRWR
jgi:hypothetical protein